MRKKFKKSYIISIVIAVVCITRSIIFAFAYVNKLKDNLDNDLTQFLTEISRQGSYNINTKINSDLKILETIATFVGCHGDLVDGTVMESLRDELRTNANFKRMGVILPTGLAFTTNGETGNLAGRDYFQKALNGVPNVAGPMADIFTGEEINVYSVPIYNQNDDVAGVLSATLDKNVFAEILAAPVFGGQGFACIVSNEGDIIVDREHANKAAAVSNIFMLNYKDLKSKQKIESDLAKGRSGVVDYYANGEKRYLSYVPVGIDNWNIVSVVPNGAVAQQAEAIIKFAVYFWAAVIAVFTALFIIISVLHFKRVKELERYMYLDDLTGIGSWKKFEMDARELLNDSHHINYALLSLDIDKFKAVRDLYGNAHADAILAKLAGVIQRNTGKYEICARYMADIFVILILYKDDDDILDRIRKIIYETRSSFSEPSIALSFGIYKVHDAKVPVAIMNDYALLAKARVKDCFDNAYCFFDDEMHALINMEKKCESLMEESLANNHFMVYFQPKYRLCDKKIAGAEALIRWSHPEIGFLSPGLFIPIFEKNGFIESLDLFVFDSVCKMLKDWLNNDIGPKVISINLSRVHLKDLEIAEKLKQIVERHEIPPQLIEIEFTENIMMEYTPILDDIVKRFHDIGFTVAMDDFGKGYSSLGLLQNLRVDVLKIDRDFFVKDMNSPRTRTIIANIIRMAKELAIETVSEGIETQEQVAILEELGCDIIQGYVFARPMPAFEFRELLLRER